MQDFESLERVGLTRDELGSAARQLEKNALTAAALVVARRQVDTNPTEDQKKAGNYRKGHISWNGLEIAIENPKGSTRSGVGKDGKTWSCVMANDYGYIKGSTGNDKDHVDVFIGPHLHVDRVYIVNQVDPYTRSFDEHKVVIGAVTRKEARRVYLSNYEDGWKGCGNIKRKSLEDFKNWILQGDMSKRANEAPIKAPLPKVRQEPDSPNCGPASLEAVAEGVGTTDKEEHQIAAEAGTTEEAGTSPAKMLAEAKRLGLHAELRQHMTIEELMDHLDAKQPVICDIQAWGDPEDYSRLEDGHYVVAVGYDNEKFYFMDPSISGTYGELTHQEFVNRWQDEATDGPVYTHAGIVILNQAPKPDQPKPETEKVGEAQYCTVCKEPWSTCHGRHGSKPCACGSGKPRNKCDCPGGTPELHKVAELARGIPNMRDYGDLSKLEPGELDDFIIQEHNAQRAGRHYDVRFGRPDTGLYSWATRKELPQPGQRRALFQTPVHSFRYGDFQGTLKGYGAGTVRRKRKGKILIDSIGPGKVEFTTADERYPQRFALIKPTTFKDQDWLLINNTPTQSLPYQKTHMVKVPKEEVETHLTNLKAGDTVQAKLDGAASLVKLLKDSVEVWSYRVAKDTGRPIVHTERIFRGRPKTQIPPEMVGSIFKGEIYGQRAENALHQEAGGRPEAAENQGEPGAFGTRRVVGPQELGGLLNATLAESLRKQEADKVKLQVMLHNVQQYGRRYIDPNKVPYADRLNYLQQALPHLPAGYFQVADGAQTPEAAKELWQQIQSGKHPLSSEGIVIHPSTGNPRKIKLTEDNDVHVTGVFPGEGKYQGVGAGGFTYALQSGGPTVGRVGTGLSDTLRKELWAAPKDYSGRVARIRSQGQFASGAHRAPAFIAFHEDYPSVKEKGSEFEGPTDGLKSGADFFNLVELGIVKLADDEEHVPTVAVDLDGTLAEELEEFDPKKIGPPRRGVRKWMRTFQRAGARLVVFTVRGDKKLVRKWLRKHNISADFINENPDQPAGASGKIIADVYWDDRAVSAKGPVSKSAPLVLDKIKAADDMQPLVYHSPRDVLLAIQLLQEVA